MYNYAILCRDKAFAVQEVCSGQLIKEFRKADAARKLARHLEDGGGFDSHTPRFFLVAV